MTENELGKAMLRVDPASDKPIPSGDLLRYLLARDKRRAWLLTAAVILIWAVVFFFLYHAISYWYDSVIPQHKNLLHVTATEYKAGSVARYQSVAIHDLNYLFFCLVVALVALSLASLGTFLLLFASRQVTLRQLSLNLRALSDHVAQIQHSQEK
jgi:hypothetical protein